MIDFFRLSSLLGNNVFESSSRHEYVSLQLQFLNLYFIFTAAIISNNSIFQLPRSWPIIRVSLTPVLVPSHQWRSFQKEVQLLWQTPYYIHISVLKGSVIVLSQNTQDRIDPWWIHTHSKFTDTAVVSLFPKMSCFKRTEFKQFSSHNFSRTKLLYHLSIKSICLHSFL